MKRQERIRRPNPRSNRLIPGKCYDCQVAISLDEKLCEECKIKWQEDAAIKADRANAVNEEFEAFKAEEQAAFQASLLKNHEEEAERRWYVTNCIPKEDKMHVPLYDIRHHPNPPQRLIDFLDFDQ